MATYTIFLISSPLFTADYKVKYIENNNAGYQPANKNSKRRNVNYEREEGEGADIFYGHEQSSIEGIQIPEL